MDIHIQVNNLDEFQKKHVLEAISQGNGAQIHFPDEDSELIPSYLEDNSSVLTEEELTPEELSEDNVPSNLNELGLELPTNLAVGNEDIASRRIQWIRLGYELDRCSGLLRVRNRYNRLVRIPRGQWKWIPVAISGSGYWYWKCGNSWERSRGSANYRQRVKYLAVYHSPNGRKITWWCYDLLY